jgi:hypothetical protein
VATRDVLVEDYGKYRVLDPEAPWDWYRSYPILNATGHVEGSLLIGCGTSLPAGSVRVLIEARYQWGLQDVNRSSLALWNRSLTLMSGVEF